MALPSQPAVISQIPKTLTSLTQAEVNAWISSLEAANTTLNSELASRRANITNWQNEISKLKRLAGSSVSLSGVSGNVAVPTNANISYSDVPRGNAINFRVPKTSNITVNIPASEGSSYNDYILMQKAGQSNDSVSGDHVLYSIDIEGNSYDYNITGYYGLQTLSAVNGSHTIRFQMTRPLPGSKSAVALKFKNGTMYAMSSVNSEQQWIVGFGTSYTSITKNYPIQDNPSLGSAGLILYGYVFPVGGALGYYANNSSANDPDDITTKINNLNTQISDAQSEIDTIQGWINTINGELSRARSFSPSTTTTTTTTSTTTPKPTATPPATPTYIASPPPETIVTPGSTNPPPVSLPPSVINNITKIKNIYNITNTITNTYYNNISNININIGATTPTRRLTPINPIIRPINLTAFITSLINASNARFR